MAPVGVTVTVAAWIVEPPGPVQVSVNVLVDAVRGALLSEPAVARLPVQPPEAVQEVAFVEDQVSVEGTPLATDAGSAASDTVGFGPPAMVQPDVAAETEGI